MLNTSDLFGINTLTPQDVIKLNQIGITSIVEIAELNQHDIQTLTQKLNLLEGRIQFEYWVEQAKDYLIEVN